jgi:DNA-3-methyladenine glycosylase
MAKRLARDFFQRDPVVCARDLIGCRLTFGKCRGMIVETEAYAADGDPACHTWRRPSAREFVSNNQAGTAYVYLNYGMHWLFNLLVKGGARDGFVLIRALEPLKGIVEMQQRRGCENLTNLCNGPAKMTQAFGITGDHHTVDPLSHPSWVLEKSREVDPSIVASTRIGISQAVDYPWRFLLEESLHVSVPHKPLSRRAS